MASDILIAVEVGSTFSKLAAFDLHDGALQYLGRTSTRTTVGEGDVRYGTDRLFQQAERFGVTRWDRAYLSSSAAGGLRLGVFGLTPSLSTKIATEIALGAGGVIVATAAGRLRAADVEALARAHPGLVLVCGGTDHGESEIVLENVRALAASELDTVFLYAGNSRIQQEAVESMARRGKRCAVADNVYPESACFRLAEVRDRIRTLFECDVVKAPGIDELAKSLGAGCVPTPMAVSRAVEAMGQVLGGGLLAFDVGGATTDVHSYAPDVRDPDVLQATFEPPLKRTVEGDLGVFHNLGNLVEESCPAPAYDEPILNPDELRQYVVRAAVRALSRHAGLASRPFGAPGREIVHGVDLRRVTAVLVTGGALRVVVSSPGDIKALIDQADRSRLVPEAADTFLVDREYLMSSLGLLCADLGEPVSRFLFDGLEKGFWR